MCLLLFYNRKLKTIIMKFGQINVFINSIGIARQSFRRLIVCLALICCFLATPSIYAQNLIVNTSVTQEISRDTLRSIYTMRSSVWDNGSAVTVYILDPAGESHRKFCLESLALFPYQLQRIWDVLVFSGTGQSPVVVDSEEEMIREVKNTPGAIGYLVDMEVPVGVKKISLH